MKSFANHSVLTSLTDGQVEQLVALYQNEWWSRGRTLSDVRMMLEHADFIFGVVDPKSEQLIAFARVLTDRVFKALIFDVIVHPDHRGSGLGAFLIDHITGHPVLSRVQHIELYCLPDRVNFYQRHGFSAELGELTLMRRSRV